MSTAIKLNQIHHTSIICSNFKKSKQFYTEVLGLKVLQEIYRSEMDSFKLDLALNNGHFIIELLSFPDAPQRASHPEACGFRHIAFEVDNVIQSIDYIKSLGIKIDPMHIDEHTNKKYTYLKDPDDLTIELYEK